jgi:hypothetical protein
LVAIGALQTPLTSAGAFMRPHLKELIRNRNAPKSEGLLMGRKPTLPYHQRQEALARRDAGETLVDSHLQRQPFHNQSAST